jgi:hypothetical protein
MTINYKGNILTKLFDVLNKKDGLSVGEKLYSIQRNLKNGLVYCSEKEYYEAMVLYLSFPVDEEDLPMTDEEFETWRNSK